MANQPKRLSESTRKIGKAAKQARAEAEENIESIPALLACPDDIDGVARETWERLVGLNNEMTSPLLNDMDKDLLRCYCFAVQSYKEIEVLYAVTTEPLLRIKAADNMVKRGAEVLKLATGLGITAIERTRFAAVQKPKPKTDSVIQGFMNE
jgi:phage terminase small subunit